MEIHKTEDCPACQRHERELSSLARANYPFAYEHQEFKKIMKQWYQTCPGWKKPHHVGNGKPKGIFAGTLTYSPNSDNKNENDMVTAIKKIMRQKTCPIKRYAWYLEYTEKGTPHIHFIYETEKGGRITSQTFKRQWDIWDESVHCGNGHRGGYHKHVADENAYMDYIAKDNNIRHENNWTN